MKILTWDSALLPYGRVLALNTYGMNSLTRNFMSM